MTALRKSPERNTFQKERYLERQAEKGLTPENDEDTLAMVDYFDSWTTREDENESDPEWSKNNLEYDLRTSEYIAKKCENDTYAQNLYAAMCNNEFTRNDVWPILQGEKWSCSWRYAGGIIAHIQQKGDYIDWYCSGIRYSNIDEAEIDTDYVGEGHITDEIRDDLLKIGWIACDPDKEDV